MTLRTRLLLGLVGLAAVGLVVAGLVTYAQLRSFLYDRVDQQVASAQHAFETELIAPAVGRRRPVGSLLPPGTYGELRNPAGVVVARSAVPLPGAETFPAPELPDVLPTSRASFTVGGEPDDFRVLSTPLRGGAALVVAVPLSDVSSTLSRLVRVELAVSALVLGGLAALAFWLVRRELQPLEAMGVTAGAIAAGDLSRRVERADAHTEVGRLGASLNGMLQQIETAFTEREAGEQRLRRFVADVSHELRTPLTSIRGHAELFRRGAADRPEDLANSMRRIEEEAARMGVLVEDLLLLARLDEGRPLGREPVDLTRVVVDIAADLRAAEPDRTVAVPGGTEPIVVAGDDGRLRQAIANLAFNALRHTPADSPIELAIRRESSSVVVEVVDHGPGLTPEQAEHAFERFWRGDASRARGSGGAGLGLAIVASIATAHGGRAGVGPTPGGGATFRLELPG